MKKKSKQGSKAAVLPTTEVTTTCREDRRFRAGLLFHEKSKQSCYAYLAEVRQSQNSCTVMDNKTKPDCFHWPLNFLDLIFFFPQNVLSMRSDLSLRKLTNSSNLMSSSLTGVPLCRGGEELDKGHIHPSLLLTYFFRKWNDQNEEFGSNPIYIYFHKASH